MIICSSKKWQQRGLSVLADALHFVCLYLGVHFKYSLGWEHTTAQLLKCHEWFCIVLVC